MRMKRSPLWRKSLLVPPIALGVLALLWITAGKEPPATAQRGEPTRTVRVIEALELDLIPTAEGYGPARPARVWEAVAQVKGRVIRIHPRLRDGEILAEGTELLRIDPVDYELALAETEAELAELRVQEQNARASLAIETRNLALAQQDLERARRLVQKGTTSKSAVDEAERSVLGASAAEQNLKNTLALIPARRKVLQTKSARAERDLVHSLIRAPFDLRVADLKVEADQFVSVGQTLFAGDAVDRVEIEVQVAMSALRRLFLDRPEFKLDPARLGEQLTTMLGFSPLVRLDLGNHQAEWEAQFVRFDDAVDAQTRTMGVVVAVDHPYDKIIPGYRPPLSKGMFVQVILRGKSHQARILVPRAAVRDGAVMVADQDHRLRRRPVTVLFSQGQISVIEQGLTPGERVLVSDLVPAVEGMLLQPIIDKELVAVLAAAGGDGS
ncbi:efflux RND transporter periplasmic adaptor subunit [Candidatus Thiosymbion oneisti]|uniref:efflux RND transporter periplasmic adaptor subunit n=1 Tax=Candidatus Thiosymbion oneisti TaxID=589554 RepID=UPI000B7D4119|nr:efflux RND transporter periplasmic adaptor subunit [Candidatus Thiosymbion oneisti]